MRVLEKRQGPFTLALPSPRTELCLWQQQAEAPASGDKEWGGWGGSDGAWGATEGCAIQAGHSALSQQLLLHPAQFLLNVGRTAVKLVTQIRRMKPV